MSVPRIVHMIRNRAVWGFEYVKSLGIKLRLSMTYKSIPDFDYYHDVYTAKES